MHSVKQLQKQQIGSKFPKTQEFYKSFGKSSKELKEVLNSPKKIDQLQTLDELIDEL